MCKISVVLPVYNGERFLEQAIDSILKQTYTDFELLIVNDCSTDRTSEIIDKYKRSDNRIRVINNEYNMRLPRSLNHGFQNAKGKYFTWTSDDNLFLPEAFQRMIDFLENNDEIGLVYCDYTSIDEKGNCIHKVCLGEPECLVGENCIGACFLYRADVARKVGGYDADLFLAEDYDYWLRINEKAKVAHIKENEYLYRMHNQSLTATRQMEIRRQTYKVFQKHFEMIFSKISEMEIEQQYFYFDRFYDFAPLEERRELRKVLYEKGHGYKWHLYIRRIKGKLSKKERNIEE